MVIKSIFCHTQNQQLLTNSCQYERYKKMYKALYCLCKLPLEITKNVKQSRAK